MGRRRRRRRRKARRKEDAAVNSSSEEVEAGAESEPAVLAAPRPEPAGCVTLTWELGWGDTHRGVD